jgi:hypothetical protein
MGMRRRDLGSERLLAASDPARVRAGPHEERMLIDVEVGAAVAAGLIAGAIMEGPVYLQKALGLPVRQNIFRTWGILFGQRGTAG